MAVDPPRPWARHYPPGVPVDIPQAYGNALAMYRAALARHPEAAAIRYFDGELTFKDVDEESSALACGLMRRGFARGDRLGLYLQNTPQFVIAVLAAWKLGGIAVPVNPMSRHDELRHVLLDAGITVLLCDEGPAIERVAELAPEVTLPTIVTSPLAHQTRDDERVLPVAHAGRTLGRPTMVDVVDAHRGRRLVTVEPTADEPAFITYTSGTTGLSKGAVNHHGAVAFSAQVYRDWVPLASGDSILGLAPMSGITGLICGLAAALIAGCPYVLHYRFDAGVVRDTLIERRPTFVVAPPTLFIALLNDPELKADDLGQLKAYCGGAPVPPALLDQWRARFGGEIRSVYGLTEATGPTHISPPGRDIPVDPGSGALSIGLPTPNTDVRVVDTDGNDVAPGQLGEFLIRGPQIVRRYWQLPVGTRGSVRDGWLHTGDLGTTDGDGWFYLVERIKDIIIASGYNIIPREVEEVLYRHPAVREAAVVGIPDTYRGETVAAFVTLRDRTDATPDELIAFVRERLSAYKCPRRVDIVTDLPKSTNGKILKRELRATTRGACAPQNNTA
jgi:long-chain acyl-CoA synthetase